ncbi:heparan-alpha-glucosaminide N-acetyltransferase domain-containing protein [Ornithinimicrobium tianjinense]|uniref:Transporter n=1 Tax=Ornithinimicrobium tianjinense TaxID=1195761 RepID=A0A917BHG5_9MICO|nr:heparan-alpha-glucosaminide N-acetyltransferase domain-containing protein [Ornithinimicrobium tianjinense]GGF42667.1 transporter [Ornithinimicrobium tianjinense]
MELVGAARAGRARTASARLVGVDLARAVALLGIFAAHLVSPDDPGAPGGVDPLFQLVAGRSSALFALLAGVGIALSSRDAGTDPWGARARLLTRAGCIAFLGLWLGAFPSGLAIILTFYGVLFCCALPVLHWRARSLAVLAVAWGLLSPVVSLVLRDRVDAGPTIVPTFVHLAEPLRLAQELLLTGYYPVLTWATYLFAGMALGRLDLRRAPVGPRLALVGAWLAALALAVSGLVRSRPTARAALVADPRQPVADWAELDTQLRHGLFGTHPTETSWWLGVWAPHSGSIVDLAHTTGTAVLVLGLALTAVRLLPALPWRLLGGAGAMTLTLYSLHALVLSSPLGARGEAALLVHTLVALGVGAAVVAAGRRGPLEQLVSEVVRLVPGRGPHR